MKKQQTLLRISQIFFLTLIGVSVVLTLIFYLNIGNVNNDDLLPKRISDMGPVLDYLTYWTYLLTAFAVFFAIGFPAIQIFSDPKSGIKALVSLGAVALMMVVAYQLGDGTIMDIAGYTGPDNIPNRLKMVDMVIFSMYGMTAIAVLVLLYSEVSKLFK